MELLCAIGVLVALLARTPSSFIFFGLASSWLYVSEHVPIELYFHLSAVTATLAISLIGMTQGRMAERAMVCATACLGVNIADFFAFAQSNEIVYQAVPFIYGAIYLYALIETMRGIDINGSLRSLYINISSCFRMLFRDSDPGVSEHKG